MWSERGNKGCGANALRVTEKIRRFTQKHCSFPGLGRRIKGTELMLTNLMENGRNCRRHDSQLCRKWKSSIQCYQHFWKRWTKKQKGVKSTHFDGSQGTVELVLRTVISVNQLSVYGAVADLCEELARRWNPPRLGIWNQWLHRKNFLLLTLFSQTDNEVQRNLLRGKPSRNSQNFMEKRNWPDSAPNDGFSLHWIHFHERAQNTFSWASCFRGSRSSCVCVRVISFPRAFTSCLWCSYTTITSFLFRRYTRPMKGLNVISEPLAGVSLAEWPTQPHTQVMGPTSPTSPAARDPEHKPIDIPENHQEFLCPDDVTMVTTSPEGLPNAEALSSSQKAAARRVSPLFGQETGGSSCKDNTSKAPFWQCELYKEFVYKSKLSKWLQRHELQLTTRRTRRNLTMWSDLKHLEEHVSVSVVDANAWVIMHCRSFVLVVSLCCQLVSLSFDCLPW